MTRFRREIQVDRRRGIYEGEAPITGMQGPPAAYDWLSKVERQSQERQEAISSFGPEGEMSAQTALQGLRRRIIEHAVPAPTINFEPTS